jgi:hypothetical protein
MGGSNFSSSTYDDLSRGYQTKSQAQVFTKKSLDGDMSPHGVTFREARDSDVHPNSVPIIVALDVTGSMGHIPENLIKNKLGTLMETLIKHGVDDAAICFCAIGDHITDDASLQIGQFESGTEELDKWLTSIYLEGYGGGQGKESYHLAWLFAGKHTSIDSFEKRGQKGFLFTIGDEFVHDNIPASFLTSYMGYKEASDISREDALKMAQRTYNVFHINCKDSGYGGGIVNQWKRIFGERVLDIDSENVAEVIASTVSVMKGADLKTVVQDFDAITAGKVTDALATLDKSGSVVSTKGVQSL